VTPADLRNRLTVLIGGYLGTYRREGGQTTPAIYVGEPPATWTATGLECRIDANPELELGRYHGHTKSRRSYGVRLTLHSGSGSSLLYAVETITQAFETSTPRQIPANERLGTLAAYTLLIAS
jgi:hypothetical protein